MRRKRPLTKADKIYIFVSILAIITIAIVGAFMLHMERAEQNVIMLPEQEYFINASAGQDAVRVNINTATKEELMLISGIGEVKADAIITYREKHPFVKPEDIQKVDGFGAKTYEEIKNYIFVE